MRRITLALIGCLAAAPAAAQVPFHDVSRQVNQKLVKVFGSGGFAHPALFRCCVLFLRFVAWFLGQS